MILKRLEYVKNIVYQQLYQGILWDSCFFSPLWNFSWFISWCTYVCRYLWYPSHR